MTNLHKIISLLQDLTLIFVNIRHKFAKTIPKWVIVLIGKNVNLLMDLKIYAGNNLLLRNFTEQDNVNHFGISIVVIMAFAANSHIMSVRK